MHHCLRSDSYPDWSTSTQNPSGNSSYFREGLMTQSEPVWHHSRYLFTTPYSEPSFLLVWCRTKLLLFTKRKTVGKWGPLGISHAERQKESGEYLWAPGSTEFDFFVFSSYMCCEAVSVWVNTHLLISLALAVDPSNSVSILLAE